MNLLTLIIGGIISLTTLSNGASSFQPLASCAQRSKALMSLDTYVDDMSDRPGLTLGFIGCGTIASAIVTGLLTQKEIAIANIYVSRRSQSKSSALAHKYGDQIIICDDNQKIVDSCGTLFVCVLPEKEEEIISGLTFGNDTTLVSLVSTSKVKDLIDRSGLPVEQVYKMICLPVSRLYTEACEPYFYVIILTLSSQY